MIPLHSFQSFSLSSYFSKSKQNGYMKIPNSVPKLRETPPIDLPPLFSFIPKEILLSIFRTLDIPELISLHLTDKRFKEITTLNIFWEPILDKLRLGHLKKTDAIYKNIVYAHYMRLRYIVKKEPCNITITSKMLEKRPTVKNINSLEDRLKWVDKCKLWEVCAHFTDLYEYPEVNDENEYREYFEKLGIWITRNRRAFTCMTTLKCPDIYLSSCPNEIVLFPNLNSIFLYDNYLQEVPSQMGSMTSLTELDLHHNYLKHLPATIEKLTNLKILNVSNNQLETVPDLSKLTALEKLNLSENQLIEITENIGALTKLKKFTLNGNPLKKLPIGILSLPVLTNLTISSSQIDKPFDELMLPKKHRKIKVIKEKGYEEV